MTIVILGKNCPLHSPLEVFLIVVTLIAVECLIGIFHNSGGGGTWNQCREPSTWSIAESVSRGVPTERRKACDSFPWVDIDASKGLVALWEHFFVVIEAIHRNGYRWKRCIFGFAWIRTCLIFPLRWACFPIKIGWNAQWEHLFSMYFDDFFIICLIF